MYDNQKKKIEQTIEGIERLKEVRSRLISLKKGSGGGGGIDEARARKLVAFLDDVQQKAESIMAQGVQAKAKMDGLAKRASALQASIRPENPQQYSKIGEKVGEMGKGVVENARNKGAVESILDSAVGITGSALKTSLGLTKTLTNATSNVAQSVLTNGGNVASSIVSTATGAAGSLIGQTANLAGSLTNTASKTISSILGSANQGLAGGILDKVFQPSQPGRPGPIDSMLSTTADLTKGIVPAAQQASTTLLGSIGSIANGLLGKSADVVGGLTSSALGFASSLIGDGPAKALNGLLSNGDKVPSDVGAGFDGLFKTAAETASSAINAGGNAIGAAADLVGGLASGLGSLGSSLLGGAADVASSIVGAGTEAVSEILDSAGEAGSGILSPVTDVASNLLGAAGDVGQNMLGAIGDLASDVANGVFEGDIGSALEGLADFAGETIGSASDLAGSVLDAAGDLASGMLDMAGDVVGGAVDTVTDLVDGLFGDGLDAADEIEGDMDDALDDIEDECLDVGEECDGDNFDDEWTDDEPDGDAGDVDYDQEQGEYEDEMADQMNQQAQNESGTGGEDNNEDGQTPNAGKNSSTTTPVTADPPPSAREMQSKGNVNPVFGWRGIPEGKNPDIPSGIELMMHDGDQQFINPYGPQGGQWTMYSFRPFDRDQGWPTIAITPASFESLGSIDNMLDNIPFIVVKEYFFKNTASTMINFIKKIMGTVKKAKEAVDNSDDAESSGSGGAKKASETFAGKIAEAFEKVNFRTAVVDIPYILYCGLRAKQYGNTYIFPYIAQSGSTVINQSSNDAEWGNTEGKGILGTIKDMINGAASMIGNIAMNAIGSQAQAANLFPAPTWKQLEGDKVQFSFDLMLINDNVIKARNNYMCVNTIIHNNRSIQKAILAFPGALYEIWLPTGQRHLMCTGKFTLVPLGLNREVPKNFFGIDEESGARWRIGTVHGKAEFGGDFLPTPHYEKEVIPDGYKLSVTFTSCLANNVNTSIFQYYVKMTGYDGYSEQQPGAQVEAMTLPKNVSKWVDSAPEYKGTGTNQNGGGSQNATQSEASKMRSLFAKAVSEVVDGEEEDDYKESFEESTFNKRIDRLKSFSGDQTITSDSVVATIRKAAGTIRQNADFLQKLYNAPDANLWYRPYDKEEIYTSLEPDYRQTLKRQYGEKFIQIREIDAQIQNEQSRLESIQSELSTKTRLEDRNSLLESKVKTVKTISELQTRRDGVADEMIQIDADIIQKAFDEQDSVVSVMKSSLTPSIFRQVWNEKIMNSYEREKLQYLTSTEKERYFKEKARELKKHDAYGVLNHSDWFFRVVVLDYVTSEMQRLVHWFKNCSYDDFDLIYRIVRKLNLLLLDVDSARSKDAFDINRTNLFFISKEDARKFTKIDKMLNEATLYELFESQIRMDFVDVSKSEETASSQQTTDKELAREQTSEVQAKEQRKVRDDVVVRVWGNESNLTKAAYEMINLNSEESEEPIIAHLGEGEDRQFSSIKQLKDRIIQLKMMNRDEDADLELQGLLGAFTSQIRTMKEALVIQEMNKMVEQAGEKVDDLDSDVNAPVK